MTISEVSKDACPLLALSMSHTKPEVVKQLNTNGKPSAEIMREEEAKQPKLP